MANAICQFTQGGTVGASGQSILGFVSGQLATMTDAAGPGAISYAWEFLSWPSPLASPPVITNANQQVATVTPVQDGVYIVRLTRTDGTGTTYDIKFFGVSDEDGLHLPSPGQTGNMTNSTLAAQKAGWAGRLNASTNTQIDAYLRFLKSRVGRYVGHVQAVSHASSSPVTVTLQDGSDHPFRSVAMTGTGSRTEDLTIPALGDGKCFRWRVAMTAGAGSFTIRNGVGGSVLATLTAPPSGTFAQELEAVYDGSAWVLTRSGVTDPKGVPTSVVIPLLTGRQQTALTVLTRVGTCRIDPTKYPSNAQIKFVAQIEATVGKTVEVRLYNLTDGGYVAPVLTTGAQIPTFLEQVVSLPSGVRDYEVHLRMTVTGGDVDRVSCTNAYIILTWG